MNKRVLLLSHCFTPYVFPESYLAVKCMGFCADCEVDVITMRPFYKWVRQDQDFFEYAQDKFAHIQYLTPPAFYSKLPFYRAESFFSTPDAYFYLNPLYLSALKNIKQYDAIVTWSMYHSIHLVGSRLKKKNPAINWVAHFSDPWTTNPFFQKGKLIRRINKYLERKVFNGADSLVFTSRETINQVLAGYSDEVKSKSYVVPHSFDEELFVSDNLGKTNKFIIRHLGAFYKERQPLSLLQALETIKSSPDSKLLDDVEVEFIGPSDREYVVPASLVQHVRFLPPIDYMSSLSKMLEANMLLIIDAPFANSPFLPSKLVDYIGANKPIFGITPLEHRRN